MPYGDLILYSLQRSDLGRVQPTGTAQQASNYVGQQVQKSGSSPQKSPGLQEVDDLKDAISSKDFDKVADISERIYDRAKKRAPDENAFYMGIKAGNGVVNDWILKELWAMRGFDGQPSQVAEQDIDADFRKGAIVAYRAVGSNPARFRQHFDNFKNGDYYAGHGIYGHGTYVAFASKGTTTHSRLDAAMAASQYGSGVMRMSLVPGKVIKQSTHTQQINRLDADFRKWAQKTRAAANPIPTKAEIQAEVQKIWQNNTVNFSPGGTFGTFDVRLTSGSSNPSKLVGLVTKAGNGYQYMDSGLNAVDVRTQKKAIDGVLSVYAEQEIMKRQIPQVKEAERRIRRTKEVLFGDAASGNQTSGRFATIQGVDAIKLDNAYDKSYMLLLNRSAVRVQKTPGQLGSV